MIENNLTDDLLEALKQDSTDYQELETRGYNLPCDHVIHTVGPIVYGALNHQLRGQLRDCYRSVLQCCVDHDIRSVAFCCISTGEFHFPKEEAAKIALETTREFLKTHDGIERVIFNVFQDEDRRIYEKILGLDLLTDL